MIDLSDLGPSTGSQSGGGIDLSDLGPSQSSQNTYWGDVKKNAMQGLKEVPQGAAAAFKTGSQISDLVSPTAYARSLDQYQKGTPLGATDVGQGAQAAAGVIGSIPSVLRGAAANIGHVIQTPMQMIAGTPLAETSLGQDFRTKPLSTAANVASVLYPVARGATRLLSGASETIPEIGAAGAEGAGQAGPAAGGSVPPVPTSGEVPNFLELKGGQGLYSNTGIRGTTIQKMTPRGQNPGVVGHQLIQELSDQGAIGGSSMETWQKVNGLTKKAGQDVGNALDAIRQAAGKSDLPVIQPGANTGDPHALFAYNDTFGPEGSPRSVYNVFGDPSHPAIQQVGYGSSVSKEALDQAGIPIVGREPRSIGQWEPLDAGQTGSPLAIDAEKALKPVLDAWAEKAGGATTATRRMAKPFEEIHNSLSALAQKQGGKLTLDDIRSAMDEIGPLTHKGAPETQEAMSELYGTLADARDGMVQQIAKSANNPTLAANLLRANKRYSQYIRILPDVGRASAMEAVGQPNLGGLIDEFKNAILSRPSVSKALLGAGRAVKGATQSAVTGAAGITGTAAGDLTRQP